MELFTDNKKNVAVCKCRHGHLKIQNNLGLSAATLGLRGQITRVNAACGNNRLQGNREV